MLLEMPIQHRNFLRAVNLAQTCGTHAAPGTLIFVVGPSGAGKSTLKRHLLHSLYGAPESWPDNQTPIISIRATNSDGGYFSSKDFFARFLGKLGDPFRGGAGGKAHILETAGAAREDLQRFLGLPIWSSIRVSMTETSLRRAAEHLARALGFRALLIDEGQSMCLTHHNRSPTDHLESLKCLAEELGILIYLFGTYDLLEIWDHSAQLNRRSQLIHLARYDGDVDGDRGAFFAVLRMLGKALPLADPKVLNGKHAAQILGWTRGVFGEIEGLLERARIVAIADGCADVGWEHIEAAKYNPVQLKRLADEIAWGEARIRGELPTQRAVPVRSNNHRPGRRKPGRDPCGVAA